MSPPVRPPAAAPPTAPPGPTEAVGPVRLERSASRPPRRVDLNAWAMAGVLVLLWGLLAVLPATGSRFLTEQNLAMLLTQNAYVMVVAVGVTLVVLIRGIDLSVGAGVALTGVVAALLQIEAGQPAWLAIAAALACGALIGLWHGAWVAWLGVPAFIVTLAGFKAYRGAALVMSDARSLAPMSADFGFIRASLPAGLTWLLVLATLAAGLGLLAREIARRRGLGLEPIGRAALGTRALGMAAVAALLLVVFGDRGMPVQVLVAAAVVLAGIVLTRRTRLGRHLYAIGGNPEAARLSGVDVKKVTLIVFTIAGVLTAIGGVLLAGRVNGVTPGNQGQLLELDVVTAVVIGGTSLAGGRGSIVGTMLGVLVFGTLANGMNLLRIDSNWQLICTGLLLLAAVLMDALLKGRRS
jgi:ABC-type xylose transport system permease subunit